MTDTSTHQLVGVVTKMFPTFGYINNQIFFQRKCVIGPMVEVGDNVATSAVYQPNMPIKWSAEKVWRVQESSRGPVKDDEKPAAKSPVHSRQSRDRASRPRDNPLPREVTVPNADRKRRGVSERRRSRSRDLASDRGDYKRRRISPPRGRSRSPRRLGRGRNEGNLKALLNIKEMIIPDISSRFKELYPPVDLYRIVCHWQDSFPLLKPLQPDRSTCFQVLKANPSDSGSKCKADSGFYVNVLLLSMPSTSTLQDKTIIRAEGPDTEKPSLQKYIKVMSVSKPKEHFKAFGGPWSPELDGEDPLKNPEVLIKTAVRVCKDQIGLDLSGCTQWHRFLEFRYSRTEGSTARPTSVLFPGSQLWGRTFTDTDDKSSNPVKPFHRIVIYFIPDIWSLMPSSDSWKEIKDAMEVALSTGSMQNFPMTSDELKMYIGRKEEASADSKDTATDNQVKAGPVSDTADPTSTAQSSTPDASKSTSTGGSGDASKTEVPKDESGLTSPTTSTGVEEGAGTNKSLKKTHEELNLSAMKVSELREQLKARNLPADGIKAQLLSRLKAAVEKEAEEAKKLEEERKRKEKELQDAQAQKEEEKKQESLKSTAAAPVPKPVLTKVTLRDYSSIIIQNRLPNEHTIQAVTLDTIMEAKAEQMDSRAYELIVCARSLLDMIRRDAIFTLFRALVSAGDRGVQAKARPRLLSERHARSRDAKTESTKDTIPFTVDVPLLFACTFLDPANREYFTSEEVEEMISALGLPASRYQVRSLVTKVADSNRIFYRSLTDAEVSPSTVKSTSLYSEIDDDEYLLELIRGGDAILDDQKDTHLPLGSVAIIPGSCLDNSASAMEVDSSTPSTVAQGLRRLEFEKSKLKKQLQSKIDEIDRLRALTETIPTLKQKLESANASINDYRQRFRTERDRTHYVHRILEQQIDSLDSSRAALRQAAHRLRGHENDSKKSTASSNSKGQESDNRSAKSETKTTSEVKSDKSKESKPPVPSDSAAKTENKSDSVTATVEKVVSGEVAAGESKSATPVKTREEPKMVNGLGGEEKMDTEPSDTVVPAASNDTAAPSVETSA